LDKVKAEKVMEVVICLYLAKWVNIGIGLKIRLPVNTSKWETQPSFSSDGKTLFFIRGFTISRILSSRYLSDRFVGGWFME
jgi:hypothetical protein